MEIALREFPKLSTAKLTDLCGVSRPFVESLRPQDATVASSRTGQDGKSYPARRRVVEDAPEPLPEDAPAPRWRAIVAGDGLVHGGGRDRGS